MQPYKLRSKRILAGREDLKALEYALYHSMGYTREELEKTLVAVVNSWKRPPPSFKRGFMVLYAEMSSSASKGAILT